MPSSSKRRYGNMPFTDSLPTDTLLIPIILIGLELRSSYWQLVLAIAYILHGKLHHICFTICSTSIQCVLNTVQFYSAHCSVGLCRPPNLASIKTTESNFQTNRNKILRRQYLKAITTTYIVLSFTREKHSSIFICSMLFCVNFDVQNK